MLQPALARIERIKPRLRAHTLDKLAQALDVPVWALDPKR